MVAVLQQVTDTCVSLLQQSVTKGSIKLNMYHVSTKRTKTKLGTTTALRALLTSQIQDTAAPLRQLDVTDLKVPHSLANAVRNFAAQLEGEHAVSPSSPPPPDTMAADVNLLMASSSC